MMAEVSLETLITCATNKRDLHDVPIEIREPQTKLTAQEREVVRGNPKLASAIFGIDFIPVSYGEYYYWDNTTLSLWEYLGHILLDFSPTARVVELGCGPYATLSIAVKKHYPKLQVAASDIVKDRVNSATKMAELNQVEVPVKQRDLLLNIDENVDLIFMNPPYVSTNDQKEISASKTTKSQEWQSGHGGVDGTDIVGKLLHDFSQTKWMNGTTLLLGINNYFISDKTILSLVEVSSLSVVGLFKPKELCTPTGPYPQVYQIKHP